MKTRAARTATSTLAVSGEAGDARRLRAFAARHAATAIRFVVTLGASAVIAWGAAQRREGAAEERREQRIAAVERRAEKLESSIVPREENAAHWAAQERALEAIAGDVRETRKTQTEILLKLAGNK